MPWKAPHPCNHPGCPELTHARFCSNHEQDASRYHDLTRPNPHGRGYGRRHRDGWRKLVLHRDPICRMCERNPSTVADHIVPLAEGGTWSLDNGQGLCVGCHAIKTDREKRARSAPAT